MDDLAVLFELDALVPKRTDAEASQKSKPGVGTGVVLVVSSDEKRSELGADLAQVAYRIAELRNRAVDQVSGDRHDVGIEPVDLAHDVLDKAPADRRSHVHVSELDETKATQLLGQFLQTDREPLDFDGPHGRPNPPTGKRDRESGRTAGEDLRQEVAPTRVHSHHLRVLDPAPTSQLAAPK